MFSGSLRVTKTSKIKVDNLLQKFFLNVVFYELMKFGLHIVLSKFRVVV